jgi:excisionase family DNA binding protein
MTPTKREKPQALSVDAAVKRSGISRPTIYRAITSGDLPSVKSAGRRLIKPEDLDAWATAYRGYQVVNDPEDL